MKIWCEAHQVKGPASTRPPKWDCACCVQLQQKGQYCYTFIAIDSVSEAESIGRWKLQSQAQVVKSPKAT